MTGNIMSTFFSGVVFKRKDGLIGARIDDETVMMSVEHGQYYGLGGVAPRVWELLENPRQFDDLVDLILQEFEVGREVCEKDMFEFLEHMEKLGLIERS